MSHYSHLILGDRYQISSYLNSNIPVAEIARRLNRHRSTVYLKIKRNKGQRGYRPKQSHRFATKWKASNQDRLTDFFWSYVEHLLTQYYSPEQIHGRLRYLGGLTMWDPWNQSICMSMKIKGIRGSCTPFYIAKKHIVNAHWQATIDAIYQKDLPLRISEEELAIMKETR